MKKTKKAAVLLIAVMLLLGSGVPVFAGGGAQADGGGKVLEIRYMGAETVGGPIHELFTAMVDKFNKDNPDVRVQADLLPSADLRTKITVEMAAGNPPEISSCITSYAKEFMRDNKIEDWRPIIQANPEFSQWFLKKNIDAMAYTDGRIMMMPTEASIDGLYYNTEIFQKYGWQPPKTYNDLLDLTKKAKAAGIALMVNGGKDIRFAWLASALMARTAGKAKTDALTEGNAMDQWDNPEYGFATAMTKFKELVDAGLYPRGVLGMSATEADQAFARGEAAMYFEGAWKGANFETAGGKEFINKLERIDFPAFTDCPDGDPSINIGGNIWGLMIPVGLNERQKDAVIRFAKAYCAPQYNAKLMETGSRVFAGVCEYDRSKTMKIFNQCVDAYIKAPVYMYSMDSYAVPSVDLAIKQTAMPGIISGEFTVAQAVAEVNKAAKDYLASRK
ncbi:MAG: ABC transporter substrate-binding protein [Treponema sp.]|jgi:raffinose/stachyose/melibiose transport system substrate-binding protein|nr:ABC transporter substrate-binding protein [Treponema sp.]